MVSPLLTILANTSGLGAGSLSANGNTVAVALCGLATEDTIEGAPLAACGFDLFAWAGAALVEWHTLQRVFDVLAAALPGWLTAAGAGDLMAHGGYLSAAAAARLSKFAADSIVG